MYRSCYYGYVLDNCKSIFYSMNYLFFIIDYLMFYFSSIILLNFDLTY